MSVEKVVDLPCEELSIHRVFLGASFPVSRFERLVHKTVFAAFQDPFVIFVYSAVLRVTFAALAV